LHIRAQRTITMDTGTGETLRDNGHDGKLLADFGYMTEGEWRAFQMS